MSNPDDRCAVLCANCWAAGRREGRCPTGETDCYAFAGPVNDYDLCDCGLARSNIRHSEGPGYPGAHAFVEPIPAPASDDEAVREIAVKATHGLHLSVTEGYAAPSVLEGVREAYRAGFEAGRNASTEADDWRAAIKIHIDAANEWRLRFKRLLDMFGVAWREGQDVDSMLDATEAARAQTRKDGGK